MTGLDLTKQENTLLIQKKAEQLYQTCKTRGQVHSDTSPYKKMCILCSEFVEMASSQIM